MSRRWRGAIAPALFLVAAACLWELGVRLFDVPDYILPSPSRVLLTFFTHLSFLWGHTLVTFLEILVGLALGASGGFFLAVAISYSPVVERTLYPLMIASQMIPVFAVAPLLIVWLGYGLWPKVTVAALISFFPVVVSVAGGLRSVSEEALDLFHSLGGGEWQIFTKLRLPSSLPSLFSGLKIAATLSVVGATIGEWVGASRGLGYLMLQSNALLRVDMVFAAILALTLVGLLLFGALGIIERRLLRWRRPEFGPIRRE